MSYFLLFLIILSSCTTGPKSKKKSVLNHLSGEHYSSDIIAGNTPLRLKRLKKNTLISGRLSYRTKNDDFLYSLKFTPLFLKKDNKEIESTTTDSKGNFVFNTYLENGKYSLIVKHKNYTLNQKIVIKDYELTGLKLIARKNQ